ncbi:hypothetical protein [uncultured Agrobacterium sp.]|uniref:hypothetical protein n=1 Tax=uncultured Agrobacterium sp. TaxID=157277 RepID=UPI0025D0A44A|nr:hypothetical protein [uncultured Agrobacterium sp.]
MFFINEKHKALSAADKAEMAVQHDEAHRKEFIMQHIFVAFALIKVPAPEGQKARREAEEKFYAETCAPGIIRRAFAALTSCLEALKRNGQQCRDSTSRDQAETKGKKEVVIAGTGNSDGASAISGHHHERLPTKNLTVQCRVPASSETSCSNSRCAGIEVSMTRAS